MNPPPVALPIAIVLLAIFLIALCIRRLRKLQRTQHKKWRRITERVLLSLSVSACLVLACTTTYNAAALRYYHAKYPAPGKIYPVDGHDMHLYCTGEGSPTLVLEAGGGDDSLTWIKVQPELSRITRVCSYDRAGFGWSAPLPDPFDANTSADRLHSLLQQAGIHGPIVLMGHSMGGIYIRAYASRYPDNIVGLIFVEAGTPTDEDLQSPELRAATTITRRRYDALVVFVTLGLHRPAGACSPDPGLDEAAGKRYAQLECGKLLATVWKEYVSRKQSFAETMNTGPYGDLPVLIFSRDPQLQRQNSDLPPKLALEESVLWDQAQEGLKRLSPRSRRVIAKGSGHPVQLDRADLVNKEVTIFIQQIRNNEQRTDYGSTVTE